MHAFMAAVLLRGRRLDQLGQNAERIHQTDNVEGRPSAVVANGTPLSVVKSTR